MTTRLQNKLALFLGATKTVTEAKAKLEQAEILKETATKDLVGQIEPGRRVVVMLGGDFYIVHRPGHNTTSISVAGAYPDTSEIDGGEE